MVVGPSGPIEVLAAKRVVVEIRPEHANATSRPLKMVASNARERARGLRGVKRNLQRELKFFDFSS